MNKKSICIRRRTRHMGGTLLNKLIAIALVTLGWISTIPDGDGTGFVFMLFIAIPMFFAKESWFIRKD